MAEQIVWDEIYRVGVEEIDTQHQNLFELYNKLLHAHGIQDVTVVSAAFEEMSNYLDKHFSTEEEYWRRDEEIYREHRALHFDFVKYVLGETLGGDNLTGLTSLLDFLSTWLLDHVQTVDKIQFQQLRNKGLL